MSSYPIGYTCGQRAKGTALGWNQQAFEERRRLQALTAEAEMAYLSHNELVYVGKLRAIAQALKDGDASLRVHIIHACDTSGRVRLQWQVCLVWHEQSRPACGQGRLSRALVSVAIPDRKLSSWLDLRCGPSEIGCVTQLPMA